MHSRVVPAVITAAIVGAGFWTGLASSELDLSAIEIIDADNIRIRGTNHRLFGFDAPEIGRHKKCIGELKPGRRARERLEQLLAGTSSIRSVFACVDSLGRPLIKLSIDGVDVGKTLIAEDQAVEYYGGRKKHSWC